MEYVMTQIKQKLIVLMSHKERSTANVALAVGQDPLGAELIFMDGNAQELLERHAEQPAVFVLEHEAFSEAVKMVRQLRQRFEAKPILVLTDERDEDLLLEAYMAGANDCIACATGQALLLAKMRVWLRWA